MMLPLTAADPKKKKMQLEGDFMFQATLVLIGPQTFLCFRPSLF